MPAVLCTLESLPVMIFSAVNYRCSEHLLSRKVTVAYGDMNRQHYYFHSLCNLYSFVTLTASFVLINEHQSCVAIDSTHSYVFRSFQTASEPNIYRKFFMIFCFFMLFTIFDSFVWNKFIFMDTSFQVCGLFRKSW